MMIDAIMEPWPWWVAGPLIGLMVPALLLLAGKSFGISGSFRDLAAICAPRTTLPYLKYNWRRNLWKVFLAAGVLIGAFVGNYLLSYEPVYFLPAFYQSWPGVIALVLGGIMVGFGTRYANGCTSGHSIMGMSNLQLTSLIATICFFIGGLIMTWLIMPLFLPG
jgi:uncharacterized membrane protein YedE/YeeE